MPRASLHRIDWGKKENTERLLAAILAAQGLKMDYHRVAKMFGYGATCNSIEGQLRKAKRMAATLPDDDDSKKIEESAVIDKDDTMDSKEAPPLVRAKKSGRMPSSSSGLKMTSEEPVVGREKTEKESGGMGAAGKRVVGGRVMKGKNGATGSGRKKAGGVKVEDEVEVFEVVHLND